MQVEQAVWAELSESSKSALRWAAAMAKLRADRAGQPVPDVEVDEFDLFVGLMLSHPGDNEPGHLLAHVGASAADVLPPDYPTPGKELEGYAARIPADRSPELTQPAAQAVQMAATDFRDGSDFVESRKLFGGLLYGSNRVGSAFRELLGAVGLTAAADSYRTYLTERPGAPAESGRWSDYDEFLSRTHPFSAAPVEVPDYKADKGVTGDDLVDIRPFVDAFAYLLASRSLKPPLAVGLFGDWGSGKTFFMDAVRNRIDQLGASDEALRKPQRELPFWKQIVQVNFNAWHYVDGDLWASLVEHVFSELRVARDRDVSELAKRQRHWLEKIEAKRREHVDVLNEIDEMKRELKSKERKLKNAQKRKLLRERALEKAEAKALEDVALKDASKQAAQDSLKYFDQATDGDAGKALAAIADARAQLQRGSGLLRAYPRWKLVIVFAAFFAVPALVVALDKADVIPPTAQVFAGVSAALALVTGVLRSVTSWTKSRLDELEKAEMDIRKDVEDQRAVLRTKVQKAAKAVATADAAVEKAKAAGRGLELEIADLELQAKSMTSGQILGDFVAERVGSTDYRKLLGTAALIQRDFGELSKLIEEQNSEFEVNDEGEEPPGPETLNRIILYIDDLDRCEPSQVIKVLQAVHLLLAFPLFVVVVAVDSRWLAHSLAEHYPALAISPNGDPTTLSKDGEGEPATPMDYLEKIFQVPFWIEPLEEKTRKAVVRGLLQGNLATIAAEDGAAVVAEPLEFTRDAQTMVGTLFDRTRAVRLQTAALTVTASELQYLDELAPLLGDTPRSVKRFVNVYQLLCALPAPPNMAPVQYEQAVGFLLALTDGMPNLYERLHTELQKEPVQPGALSAVLEKVRPTVPSDEMTRYDGWAQTHGPFATGLAEHMVEPARRVHRFTFRR